MKKSKFRLMGLGLLQHLLPPCRNQRHKVACARNFITPVHNIFGS